MLLRIESMVGVLGWRRHLLYIVLCEDVVLLRLRQESA
jgi:hypothetical protein